MKTYRIIYTESLYYDFYVDAESKDEARAKFNRKAENGDLDFSDGEPYDAGVESIEEVKHCYIAQIS